MKLRTRLQLYPFLRLSVALMAGIVVADQLGERVAVAHWLWLVVGFLALAMAASRLRKARWTWVQGLFLMVTTFFLGATLVCLEHGRLRVTLSADDIGYEAVVASEPQVRGKTVRMDLLVTHVEGRPLSRPVSVRASLLRDTLSGRWRQLRVGSGLNAYSTLEVIDATERSGHFDYARWAQVHGYQAQTFIYYRDWHSVVPDLSVLSTLQRARLRMLVYRQRLLQRYRALGLDQQQYAVVAAMTLGDKSALSQATKDSYSVSGASHVLALSGLHLGIVYAVLTFLLGGRKRRSWVGQALVLSAVWSYALLVGLPASVVRSATMLTVYSCCVLLRREHASANALALAALVMLVANPLSLWDVSFQLSFLAVLGILVYQPRLFRLWHPKSKPVRWAWGMVTVSLAAQMATSPLVAYYFGRFSCYFLLTNFMAVPAATLILYGAIALFAATPFAVVAQGVASALVQMACWLNEALSLVASWPGASVEDIRLSLVQVVLLYVMLLSLTVIVTRVGHLRGLGVLDTFNRSKHRNNNPASDVGNGAIDDAGLMEELRSERR